MNISVTIKQVFSTDKPTKAFADVVIDNSVIIHGVRLVQKNENKYITMPQTSWKTLDGEVICRDVVHPISSSARKTIRQAVIDEYEKPACFVNIALVKI